MKMKLNSGRFLVVAALFGLAATNTANATNGMWMIGYGAKATGMGGAGIAYPQDAMATAYNPASMTGVGEARLDATLELFYPPRAAVHDSSLLPMDQRSRDDLFPIPAIGAVLSNPATPFAMGMAVVGAGLGTNYNQEDGTMFRPTGIPAYKNVGVFLMQMQMLPSLAYKIDENNSLGFSLVIAMQTFRAFGLEAFSSLGFTNDTSHLTNRGYDWSFGGGYKLGWFGTYFDQKLNLGLTFAPKVHMQKFNRYSGLFAKHGEFDIPESYGGGLAIKLTPKVNVAFDVERILWSKVPSIGNPGPDAANPSNFFPLCPGTDKTSCLTGGDNGLGFGWTNQTVYKLGFDYKYNKDLTLRAGLNYGKAPIPPSQVLFNVLAPATVEKHVTFGATWTQKDNNELTLTYMHAFKNTIKGPTAFGPVNGLPVVGTNGSIAMSQTSVSIAYGIKF
jgi:long-chain fatty acid transport protein